MVKNLFLIWFCLFFAGFSFAQDFVNNENTFQFNFSKLEKEKSESNKIEMIDKIENNLLKYPDFKEFTENNFEKIIKYKFWKKTLIFSSKEFVKKVSQNDSFPKKVQNFALLNISEDMKTLDEIYHFFDIENDDENKNYAKQQAMYTLFNKSQNLDSFKDNIKFFKWIDPLNSFNEFFPNHSFVLEIKEEIKKEKELENKKALEILNAEKKKQLYYYLGLALIFLFFVFILFRLVKKIFIKTPSKTLNENMSFEEILSNAPVMELFKETQEKIDQTIENTPALKDALMPFANDYGISFEDTVLISEYIQSKSMVTVSGIEKLKELCADCKTGIVYSKKENGFLVLCRKEVY